MTPVKSRITTWLVRTVLIAVSLWAAFLGLIAWAMRQPPETFGRVMAKVPAPAFLLFPFETMWMPARAGHLNAGEVAPDFSVERLETKTPVSLASLWATKPVVLVFGSYT
jgi:hypothetical protein